MFERFTKEARQAVIDAQTGARAMHHGWIGTEHVLLGLTGLPETVAGDVLASFGVTPAWVRSEIERMMSAGGGAGDADALATIGIDLDEVRRRIEEAFGPGALDRGLAGGCGRNAGHLPFTPRAKKALELSLREAVALEHGHIGTEHILLGLLREGRGVAAQILAARGMTLAGVRAAVLDRIGNAAR